ncbi:MAG: DUF2577 domain-containing protein [Candidatus Metalachnospira sp.]|nr:DUF2577 domain-containing protein [Candidatus Metalachnospira sp.]
MSNLLGIIKKAAQDVIENSKPADVEYGTVMSISPLTIMVDQKRIYSEGFLVVTKNLTDFEVDVTVNWSTESTSGGSGYDSFSSHVHSITGRKKIIIHNGLKVGEKVALLRLAGGQEFLVIDRVV